MKHLTTYLLLGLIGLQTFGFSQPICPCTKSREGFSAHCKPTPSSTGCAHQKNTAPFALKKMPCCAQQSLECRGDDMRFLAPTYPPNPKAPILTSNTTPLFLPSAPSKLYFKGYYSAYRYTAPFLVRSIHLEAQAFLL